MSKLFPIRKTVALTFNEEMENNRKSTLSEVALKTSSSLLSVSELDRFNQSISVPDLRAMQDETRYLIIMDTKYVIVVHIFKNLQRSPICPKVNAVANSTVVKGMYIHIFMFTNRKKTIDFKRY